MVEEEFERFNKSGRFVAGVVIEPVQAGGGDVHTSLEIFQVRYLIHRGILTFIFSFGFSLF